MKSIWLIVCVLGLLYSSSLIVMAECLNSEHRVLLPESWCCPNRVAMLACMEALGKPFGDEVCYSFACYHDFLDEVRKERDIKKAKEAAEHRKAQEDFDRKKAKERSNLKAQEWFDHQKQKERAQQKADEEIRRQKQLELEKEIARKNEEARRQQEQAQKDRDRFPPPLTSSESGKKSGRLVVRPCGHGRWNAGVCCCPDQASVKRVPSHLHPQGYGPLPSPDTLWDECSRYGCWPPPHSYE